jgi:Zn-dependent M28 family amino/carboxypeptidase
MLAVLLILLVIRSVHPKQGFTTQSNVFFIQDVLQCQAPWPTFDHSTIMKNQEPDEELKFMLSQIDPSRIKAIIEKLVSFGTRHTLSSQTNPVRGIGAARDWVASEMRRMASPSQGRMTVSVPGYEQAPQGRITAPVRISNILARLEGSADPERVYVVSGHYDSMPSNVLDFDADAPGANDDASGVAVVMELARIMAIHRPRSTILFAVVAGEEQGLFGSSFMAKTLKSNNTNVEAMLNNDIVGNPRGSKGENSPHVIRLFAQGIPETASNTQVQQILRVGGENDSPTRQLARFVQSVASNSATQMDVAVIYRTDRYGRNGDHSSFLRQGYPAVRFTEPHENFAHQHQNVRVQNGVQYGDLLEFVDFEYVARVAKVNLATLWSLSMSPGKVPFVKLDPTGMVTSSTLSWGKPHDNNVKGFEVVWRSTTSPSWTNAIDVGDVTKKTIDLSKDNIVFGVRAIGRNGYKGPITAAGSN